jgi:tetratricopeptide (TPR) repeat protein
MKEQGIKDKIFMVSNCPDAALIFNYTKGKLQEDVAWNIEKHITDCPLCADALEGLILVSGTEVLEEVGQRNNYSNNFNLQKHKGREIKIVITASVMAITSLVILFLNKPESDKSLSPAKEIISKSPNKIGEEQQVFHPDRKKNEFVKKPEIAQNPISPNAVGIAVDSHLNANYHSVISDSSLSWVTTNTNPSVNDNSKENNPVLTLSGLPVTYIHQLKAIDYSAIYDELDNNQAGLLKSLDARYSNVKSMEAARQIQPTEDTLTYSKILSDALLDYHDQKFFAAQQSFEKILSIYPDDQNALFYGALSYYHLGKPVLAIQQLEKILGHRQSPFNEEAQWYIALGYHQSKQDELCKVWLEKVIDEKGFYEMKAKELLNELK